MDMVTGAQVSVALIVPISRERMWDLITAVDRIGEWSPETAGAQWSDGTQGPQAGGRFSGYNRFPSGFESTVTCVVTESAPRVSFAWDVLDDAGQVGSSWRYELLEGSEPGSTEVRHSFTHGPGATGAREGAVADPRSLDQRLVTLCQNMTSTIAAMVATQSPMGAIR
jgi:uncharacterized protein YndB with AHSA1/START domain